MSEMEHNFCYAWCFSGKYVKNWFREMYWTSLMEPYLYDNDVC